VQYVYRAREIYEICESIKRDKSLLCVEMPGDLLMMEQNPKLSRPLLCIDGRLAAGWYRGQQEINPERLFKRAADGLVKEVILATNFTVEGEATAQYVSRNAWRRASRCRASRAAIWLLAVSLNTLIAALAMP
jgi:recombinational DNA repair protein RecR